MLHHVQPAVSSVELLTEIWILLATALFIRMSAFRRRYWEPKRVEVQLTIVVIIGYSFSPEMSKNCTFFQSPKLRLHIAFWASIVCLSWVRLWWQQPQQGIPETLYIATLNLLLGDPRARLAIQSLQRVLGLPRALPPELLTLSLRLNQAILQREQISSVISFFRSLPAAHDYRWGLDW